MPTPIELSPEQPASPPPFYDKRFVPFGYDVLIRGIFLPFGGVGRLRSRALDRMELRPGTRVLELGCGTGGITRLLVQRGAQVTAVDGSHRMLSRARRRAPQATYFQSRVESFAQPGTYDRVLFAFVLHELSASVRRQAIAGALARLPPDGLLAILDHAVPASRGLAAIWRSFLLKLEPPTVAEIIAHGYDAELAELGIDVIGRHQLAGGTAQLIIGRKSDRSNA